MLGRKALIENSLSRERVLFEGSALSVCVWETLVDWTQVQMAEDIKMQSIGPAKRKRGRFEKVQYLKKPTPLPRFS